MLLPSISSTFCELLSPLLEAETLFDFALLNLQLDSSYNSITQYICTYLVSILSATDLQEGTEDRLQVCFLSKGLLNDFFRAFREL